MQDNSAGDKILIPSNISPELNIFGKGGQDDDKGVQVVARKRTDGRERRGQMAGEKGRGAGGKETRAVQCRVSEIVISERLNYTS